jgi:hypothetical protein
LYDAIDGDVAYQRQEGDGGFCKRADNAACATMSDRRESAALASGLEHAAWQQRWSGNLTTVRGQLGIDGTLTSRNAAVISHGICIGVFRRGRDTTTHSGQFALDAIN